MVSHSRSGENSLRCGSNQGLYSSFESWSCLLLPMMIFQCRNRGQTGWHGCDHGFLRLSQIRPKLVMENKKQHASVLGPLYC